MDPHTRQIRPLLSETCHTTSMMSRRAFSDIIGCDEELVVKLYSNQTPRAVIDDEVFYTKVAREHGLMVPQVIDIVKDDDRWGYSYRLVQGSTLLHEAAYNQGSGIVDASMVLASIHWIVHGHYDDRLPPIKSRLRSSIETSPLISKDLREETLIALTELPDGRSICHGDLHPENVIMAPEGPTLLDWVDAAVGDPMADVARTAILLEVWLPKKVRELDLHLSEMTLAQLRDEYVDHYIELNGGGKDRLRRWLLPVAVARLCQGVVGEREELLTMIDGML